MTMANKPIAAFGIMLVFLPALAFGHGFMYEPQARNVVHNSGYCPHCLQMGGPEYVSGQKTLTWPAGNRGVCGDKAGSHDHEPGGRYGPAGIQATYSAGQDITISLHLTTQHGGRHMFRLCDRTDADESCFAAHVLQRSDGAGPYTWTPKEPVKGPSIPDSIYTTATVLYQPGESYSMQYRLPAGVTCSACTLQWWWTTSNTCNVPGNPFGEANLRSCDGPQPGPYPEEFVNCADISIGGDESTHNSDSDPASSPSETPVSEPEVIPEEPAPTPDTPASEPEVIPEEPSSSPADTSTSEPEVVPDKGLTPGYETASAPAPEHDVTPGANSTTAPAPGPAVRIDDGPAPSADWTVVLAPVPTSGPLEDFHSSRKMLLDSDN